MFYESKRRTQQRHQEAADMNNVMRHRNRQRRRAISGTHALQILQYTLNLQRATTPIDRPRDRSSVPDFEPSKRLQDLFEHYIHVQTESMSETSSLVDYDALAFMELTEQDIYQNLQKVWSMCVLNGDEDELDEDEDDDIDMDIDYDALIAADVDLGLDDDAFFKQEPMEQEIHSYVDNCNVDLGESGLSHRLVKSTPSSLLRQDMEKAKITSSL